VKLTRPTATSDGEVRARFRLSGRARFGARRHTADVLLVDRSSGNPLGLDYNSLTSIRRRGGRIGGVDLRLPAGTELPGRLRAYVIADVFPLGSRGLR
jgi:hypothetical protein